MRKKVFLLILFCTFVSTTFSATKKVFLEEITSSGWGTCSRGAATLDSLSSKHGENLIALSYHYQIAADNVKFDPMHVYFGEKFGNVCNYPNLGYQVDRSCPSNKLILGTSFKDAIEDVEQYFDMSDTYCDVQIKHNYNSNTREITGKVNIKFDDIPESGEYSLMLVVLQDSILYKQYDYGMSTAFGIPYVEPSIGYIDSFCHNHVVRDGIINGEDSLWGEIFTSNPSNGDSYTVDFNYQLPEKYEFSGPGTITIPAKYDPEKVVDELITLVAYVSRSKSEVVNADKSYLIKDSTPILKVGNNKTGKPLKISTGILSTDAFTTAEVFNVRGKSIVKIKSGKNLNLNKLNLSQGQYFIKMKDIKSGKILIKNWIKY